MLQNITPTSERGEGEFTRGEIDHAQEKAREEEEGEGREREYMQMPNCLYDESSIYNDILPVAAHYTNMLYAICSTIKAIVGFPKPLQPSNHTKYHPTSVGHYQNSIASFCIAACYKLLKTTP